MKQFAIKKIFTQEEIHELRKFYYLGKKEHVKQFYNIWNCDRFNPHKEKLLIEKILQEVRKEIKDPVCTSYYFLNYKKNSFTTLHRDDGDKTKGGCTVVTLLDQKELIGGQTLIYDRINKPPQYDEERYRGVKWWELKDNFQTPIVVEAKVGDSMIYTSDVKHGVAKVHSGERLVLITWFKSRGEK